MKSYFFYYTPDVFKGFFYHSYSKNVKSRYTTTIVIKIIFEECPDYNLKWVNSTKNAIGVKKRANSQQNIKQRNVFRLSVVTLLPFACSVCMLMLDCPLFAAGRSPIRWFPVSHDVSILLCLIPRKWPRAVPGAAEHAARTRRCWAGPRNGKKLEWPEHCYAGRRTVLYRASPVHRTFGPCCAPTWGCFGARSAAWKVPPSATGPPGRPRTPTQNWSHQQTAPCCTHPSQVSQPLLLKAVPVIWLSRTKLSLFSHMKLSLKLTAIFNECNLLCLNWSRYYRFLTQISI